MKKYVGPFEYAEHICNSMKKGILLTTAQDRKYNTMTIGWGKIGIEWGKPVFIAYVRESRYTKQLLEGNGEFTVNIPFGECGNHILGYCGTKSGRDTDKFADLGLTAVSSDKIAVPGIKELPLTLECKVIYKQRQDLTAISQDVMEKYYPVVDEEGNRDRHIAYYGEILSAYVIE